MVRFHRCRGSSAPSPSSIARRQAAYAVNAVNAMAWHWDSPGHGWRVSRAAVKAAADAGLSFFNSPAICKW
jgi:hypothetical protein